MKVLVIGAHGSVGKILVKKNYKNLKITLQLLWYVKKIS